MRVERRRVDGVWGRCDDFWGEKNNFFIRGAEVVSRAGGMLSIRGP